MKRYLFGLGLLGALHSPVAVLSVHAQGQDAATSPLPAPPQDKQPAGPRPSGPRGAELLQELALSDKQQAKVEAIFKNEQQQMNALRGSAGADREKAMSSRRRIENQTDAKLKMVLTSEQYAKYQAKQQEQPRPPKDGQRPPRQKDTK